MQKKLTAPSIWMIILAGIVSLLASSFVFAGDVTTMSKDELKARLGNDDLIILDVRTGRDWSSSEFKVQGAQRASSSDFNNWSASLPKDKTLVLYCA